MVEEAEHAEQPEEQQQQLSFKELGLVDELCDACKELGYHAPTDIQQQSLPYALQKRDVIGLAQTGSGKTAAFSLPILQHLLLGSFNGNNGAGTNSASKGIFACILTPTRELAFQIGDCLEALGSGIGVKCAVIVGGVDMMDQSIALSRKPHVIVCTPGRLVDHLESTKGFHLKTVRVLVMDEADRLLSMDFEKELETILKQVPRERQTMLFSATMTDKVAKLQRASLQNPVKVSVSTKYSTVDTLLQYYLFIPLIQKECYLTYILNEISGQSCIVFTATCQSAQKLALMLRALGFGAVALHGQMPQPKRLGALAKFASGSRSILIATDVASRGLDLPKVDVVLNFDIPTNSKTYIHRVGRTARAGRSGKSITLVSQYDVEMFQRLEGLIGKKMDLFPTDKESVMVLQERVAEAQRQASLEMEDQAALKSSDKRKSSAVGGRLDKKQAYRKKPRSK